jgi:hypothetical protein
MLAYVFWHRQADREDRHEYEQAVVRFHRSLHARPPDGFRDSASFRAGELPWLGSGYEDWYLVDDFAALGVLGEATQARGHRTAHDEAARRSGRGAGGVYRLLEGVADFADARIAVWVERPAGTESLEFGALLGDGMDPARASLWRRQLVLGPAPEYCVLGVEEPAGTRHRRLADGWRADLQRREPIWTA